MPSSFSYPSILTVDFPLLCSQFLEFSPNLHVQSHMHVDSSRLIRRFGLFLSLSWSPLKCCNRCICWRKWELACRRRRIASMEAWGYRRRSSGSGKKFWSGVFRLLCLINRSSIPLVWLINSFNSFRYLFSRFCLYECIIVSVVLTKSFDLELCC